MNGKKNRTLSPKPFFYSTPQPHAQKCPICYGSGKYNNETCHGCGGKGWVRV